MATDCFDHEDFLSSSFWHRVIKQTCQIETPLQLRGRLQPLAIITGAVLVGQLIAKTAEIPKDYILLGVGYGEQFFRNAL